MLAEFRVTNFKSFKDEQVLSLIATQDEINSDKVFFVGDYQILKVVSIYGSNASGKSNLIMAMDCMNDFVVNSAGYKHNEEIPVKPFLFNEQSKREPTKFEITFFIDGIRYQYGLAATIKEIHNEYLLAWPNGREQRWFERNLDQKEPYFGPSFRGPNKTIWGITNKNVLFLSNAAKNNHTQCQRIYDWFDNQFRKLPDVEVGVQLTEEHFYRIQNSRRSTELHNLTLDLLRKADFGICDFTIQKVDSNQYKFPDFINEKQKQKLLNELERHPLHQTSFSHCDGNLLPLDEESDGTRKFYSILGPLLESVAHGYTIYKDELESNLHSLLTRAIIDSISNLSFEETCAQLIFTTHDTTLLDPELLGRGQVWFTEKGKDGATRLYSLADYKDVRKDEAMQKRYLAGRYGAIPILERFNLSGTKEQ